MKTLAVVAAVTILPGFALAQAWNHNPASPNGPPHWGSVAPADATCGDSSTGEVGKKQSPIDIDPGNAITATFSPLMFRYKPAPLKIENNGHTVEAPYAPTSYLFIGSEPVDAYQLSQFHFHAPSEHTIGGVKYDAELHLVHTNTLGEITVVGVLLTSSAAGLPIFDTIMARAPKSPGEIEVSQEINATDLLPSRRGFYRYAGSLTTPACSETVQWIVMQEPVPITPAALAKLHKLIASFPGYNGYSDNNRPVANQNGRAVFKSTDTPKH